MIVVCLMIIGALGQSAVAMETNSAANHQTHTEHHQHQSQKKAQIKSKVLDRSARIQFNKSLNLNDVHVEVNGMVCAFCAQGIQKAFEKHPSIQCEGYPDRTNATNYFRAVVVPMYALEYFALPSSIKNRPSL